MTEAVHKRYIHNPTKGRKKNSYAAEDFPEGMSTIWPSSLKCCPLLNVNIHAREIALKNLAGHCNVCSCCRYETCPQCIGAGSTFRLPTTCLHAYCTREKGKGCLGRNYFTVDQIFFLPGFDVVCKSLERATEARRMIEQSPQLRLAPVVQNSPNVAATFAISPSTVAFHLRR